MTSTLSEKESPPYPPASKDSCHRENKEKKWRLSWMIPSSSRSVNSLLVFVRSSKSSPFISSRMRSLVIGSSFFPLYRIALGRLPLCPFFFFILRWVWLYTLYSIEGKTGPGGMRLYKTKNLCLEPRRLAWNLAFLFEYEKTPTKPAFRWKKGGLSKWDHQVLQKDSDRIRFQQTNLCIGRLSST